MLNKIRHRLTRNKRANEAWKIELGRMNKKLFGSSNIKVSKSGDKYWNHSYISDRKAGRNSPKVFYLDDSEYWDLFISKNLPSAELITGLVKRYEKFIEHKDSFIKQFKDHDIKI